MRTRTRCLVVGLPLHPGAGAVAAEEVLPALIVDEDEDREGEGGQPPVDVQRVHSQALVHAGAVGQEGSQGCLEKETKVHEHVLHSLLEDGVLPCLANDEISPLDDDNGNEEGSVAGVLEDLPVCVRPLLPVRVFKVVHSLRVPGPSQTQEC